VGCLLGRIPGSGLIIGLIPHSVVELMGVIPSVV